MSFELEDVPFDSPFMISEDGSVVFTDDYPPNVYDDGESTFSDDSHWEFYSRGYTCQWGVKRSDPVMHPSEYLGGRLARDMWEDCGTYVVTTVTDLGDSGDLMGWTVLRLLDES